MLRGAIYSVSLILVFFLTVALLEYFGNFNTKIRTFLFWFFIISSSAVCIRFFFIPLFKLFHFGKTLSHEQASVIIGKHFHDVKDKLLNTLQLYEQNQIKSNVDRSLIEASINQKITELKPVPFTSAVDFSENRKYIKFIIPPVAIVIVLLFAAPSILTDPADRLVRHSEEIIKVAPYTISLSNSELSVAENEDFTLEVELSGELIPQKLYIVLNGQQLRLNRGETKKSFDYTFRNVQKNTPFSLYADGFYSEEYTLKTLPAPLLMNFNVSVDYPSYVNKKDEVVSNTGDLNIPVGSSLQWNFQTKNTQSIKVKYSDTTYTMVPDESGYSSLAKQLFSDKTYSIHTGNEFMDSKDSIMYRINVIPDLYPMIAVDEEEDTLSKKHLYFTGEIKDDYGFKKLTFNYLLERSENENSETNKLKSQTIAISSGQTQEQFFHHWNLDEIGITPGDELSYYFEVWDNDGVHGSKSSKTQMRVFKMPSMDELLEERDQQNEDIKGELEESIDEAKELKKELDELRKELLQKEELSWQDKKKLEELLKKQKNLQSKVEDIQKKNEQKNQQEESFKQQNEDILEKQKKIDELFNELMNDEMKKLYEELQKMMEEMKMEEIQEQLEEMDMSSDELEKELDRALEQFKQMEWEMKMEETIDKLEKLAEKQEKLAEESKEKDSNSEELKEKQDELNKEFEELQKEMEENEKLNEELEEPNPTPDTEQKEEEIKEEMEESSDSLEKKKKGKASDSQKNAAEKMEKMAQEMEMMMAQEEEESLEEDMDALRALLENIVTLSFDQEGLMANIKTVGKNDPKYVSFGQDQRKLKDDAKMVEDSLFALSKRIIQLQAPVNREISLVNDYMGKALDEIGERKTKEATSHQQYVMTSFNNLALLLDEALQQMQKKSECNKPGQGNCNKPGGKGKKPSAAKMKKMQDALGKQLSQMKKKMEGFNKGENKSGKGEMSKELAKMAAKQAAIRREMEKMGEKLNEDGSGSGNAFKKIAKEMEQIEKDLVNKQVNVETLKRQQDILTRLLKAENAEREREMDNQRKSKEARENQISKPMKYSEYEEQKKKELEMLKTLPPSLKPFYKEKVNNYFNKLDH